MGSKVSQEQAEAIHGILGRVSYVPRQSVSWGRTDAGSDWHFAKILARDLAAYKPNGNCIACHFRTLNILREAVDLPPVGGEASDSLRTRRLAVCRASAPDHSDACPAWHSSTDSCGRLLVDAIAPDPVTLEDGRRIMPCGCNVGVKASFKFFKCPAARWPYR